MPLDDASPSSTAPIAPFEQSDKERRYLGYAAGLAAAVSFAALVRLSTCTQDPETTLQLASRATSKAALLACFFFCARAAIQLFMPLAVVTQIEMLRANAKTQSKPQA